MQTLEAYEALYGFLNHLLTEDPKGKNLVHREDGIFTCSGWH